MINLLFFYSAFALGTFAGSCFLYSITIFSQTLLAFPGFSGLVFFFLFLPFPLFFWFTGALLDRFSKKNIVIYFQGFLFLASLCLAIDPSFFLGKPYFLLLVAFTNGIGMTAVLPGRMAFLRDVVPKTRLVFHTIAGNLLLIVSFGISPFLVGWIKESQPYDIVFLLLSSLHWGSILLFSFVIIPRQDGEYPKRQQEKHEPISPFLAKDPVARQVLYVAVLSMLALGPIQVVLPKYVREILGLGELARGTVLMSLGPGLFLGGILTILLHHTSNKGRVLLVVLLVSAVLFLGLVPFLDPRATAIFLFCFGIAGGVISSLMPALLQARSTDGVRGRLLSLYSVCFQFTPAVSGWALAYFSDRFGLVFSIQIFGLFLTAIVCFAYFRFRELRTS